MYTVLCRRCPGVSQGKDINEIACGMQDDLDRITNWCKVWEEMLNSEKAVESWFSPTNYSFNAMIPRAILTGYALVRTRTMTYVGETF